jgi:microcystin degradation protein MlrC
VRRRKAAGLGITLADKKIVVAKSSNHFRHHFRAIGDRMINVAT